MAGHDKSIWFNELEPSSLNNGLASLFGLKPGAAFPTTNQQNDGLRKVRFFRELRLEAYP